MGMEALQKNQQRASACIGTAMLFALTNPRHFLRLTLHVSPVQMITQYFDTIKVSCCCCLCRCCCCVAAIPCRRCCRRCCWLNSSQVINILISHVGRRHEWPFQHGGQQLHHPPSKMHDITLLGFAVTSEKGCRLLCRHLC